MFQVKSSHHTINYGAVPVTEVGVNIISKKKFGVLQGKCGIGGIIRVDIEGIQSWMQRAMGKGALHTHATSTSIETQGAQVTITLGRVISASFPHPILFLQTTLSRDDH